MTYAQIGIREGRTLTVVGSVLPMAEAVKEFKAQATADGKQEHDGTSYGVLELYELRPTRTHRLRRRFGSGAVEAQAETEPTGDDDPADANAEPETTGRRRGRR